MPAPEPLSPMPPARLAELLVSAAARITEPTRPADLAPARVPVRDGRLHLARDRHWLPIDGKLAVVVGFGTACWLGSPDVRPPNLGRHVYRSASEPSPDLAPPPPRTRPPRPPSTDAIADLDSGRALPAAVRTIGVDVQEADVHADTAAGRLVDAGGHLDHDQLDPTNVARLDRSESVPQPPDVADDWGL